MEGEVFNLYSFPLSWAYRYDIVGMSWADMWVQAFAPLLYIG